MDRYSEEGLVSCQDLKIMMQGLSKITGKDILHVSFDEKDEHFLNNYKDIILDSISSKDLSSDEDIIILLKTLKEQVQ